MSSLRFKVVDEAIRRKALDVQLPAQRPSEYFGMYVFTQDRMRKYLPKNVYEALVDTMNNRTPLSRELAMGVAAGMKQWAMEMGATHYTHWFQPLNGGTAEKHDAFVEHDGHGGLIEEFSGKLLIQQEPDASSFPNGGIRNTFEARGYSAWDPTSPAFIVDSTLCIPTIFIAYTGEALDFKTPLLKSIAAVDKAATSVCKLFDPNVKKVTAFLGWEQEYFLVDEGLWAARPDLILTGRTLMGHESAKNQQLEDHYFGSIPTRVAAFMKELDVELLKLGIPVKTRHNEVAPNQFELAPIYEEANLANDHNLLLMSVIHRIARKHCFRCLLHEKPFKGINGSGKHNNWSLGTDTGVNLFSPGKTPKDNLLFVTFLVNTMMAVYKYNGLLKASISSATNAHRLGANEAPPAIISVFLGRQLNEVLDKIESSTSEEAIKVDDKSGFKLGIAHIPELLLDNTDRNRTSPFAFTGNRFEFRAVGSSANCGGALTVINTAVAHQLTRFRKEIDELTATHMPIEKAIFTVLKKYIKECEPIRFDGNGYSEEWKIEAAKRGLDTETSIPLIFDRFLTSESVDLFTSMNVLSEVELHARTEVDWETYTKKVQIEARVLGDLAMNHILPVASRYQSLLLDKVYKVHQIFRDGQRADMLSQRDVELIEQINDHISAIQAQVNDLVNARKVANKICGERAKAIAYHDTVVPLMDEIRYHIDKLELMVDNEMWTLPKYRELLFLK
ncbi:glutamine synthetase III [Rikenella microfusus]|uniref:Glutamine synthetase n=1 Tax=Rikenella microfusus TaxID=28139 RepID=A0A379MPX9_9BACT|nr:glutamine synthetase III [Rikenella microfusus]SUE32940.1 Glutamine synthetase [Rikenella microfusus]HJE89371.1 glutamine synthetase III [Rikenella microfusus]